MWTAYRLIIFILTTLLITYSSITTAEEGSYYNNSKRGYWWYEDPIREKKEKQEKKDEKTVVFVPNIEDYSYRELMSMHPDEFKPLMAAFLKKAVQHPSEDNVREYYIIQDVARRKALAFANVASYVMQRYPDLDVSKDYPVAAPGRNALARMVNVEIKDTLAKESNDFALLYFYSPDCQYCQEQNEILKYFLTRHPKWEVKHINIYENVSLAGSFGVETVPFIVLIYRYSMDHFPISAGVISVDELESRIYRSIKTIKGEKVPENWSLYDFQKGTSAFDVESGEKIYNDFVSKKKKKVVEEGRKK